MKNLIRRSKSQDCHSSTFENQVIFTILLSNSQQITIPIPFNCPLDIINSTLTQKISERQEGTVIGFESIPPNYLFDYKLSKNIGNLITKENLTLKCLYKPESNDKIKKQAKISDSSPFSFQFQYFKKIAKYKLCKPLSSGGFSRVYLVRNMQDGQFYAAKFMQKTSQVNVDREQAIQNEFIIHKSLDHPFIVKMQEYFETDEFYVLIMEYCPGGELFTLLKNNRYMSEDKAKVIFIQILIAIKYLHDRNIVFRDIKPENILIDAFGNAKVTDFGLAKEIRDKTNSYCGSVEYMAPEIVSKQSYSFDVDLYCMGALLYEILIGCPPFYNPNFTSNETKYHICNSQISFPRKVTLSNLVKQLIAQLLVKDPSQRLGHNYGVTQILDHEWIGNISIHQYLNGQIRNPFIPNLDIENFDRQEDENELSFRNKILRQFKKIKNMCAELKTLARNRQLSLSKNKSQSTTLLPKKHLKSKSQDQFTFAIQNKRDSVKQLPQQFKRVQQESPYATQLKNKSLSQMIHGYRTGDKYQYDQKQMFKKKKQNRTLSRSNNKSTFSATKSPFDPQNNTKVEMGKALMINSKSCTNSRKNSLYKRFIQSGNQSKSNKLDFMSMKKIAKIFQPSNSRQSVGEDKEKQQNILRRKSSSKEKFMIKQTTELYIPKQVQEKQNKQMKGLAKKVGNKKYIFTSSIKDMQKIKQTNFNFQRRDSDQLQKAQNRQTCF